MSTVQNFSDVTEWGQRFAIIHSLNLNDSDIKSKFEVTSAELKEAKQRVGDDSITIDTDFDVEPFKLLLANTPASATKKVKPVAEKTRRIQDAMENIPINVESAVLFADFIVDFPVSLHCVRQQQRFDHTDLGGKIRVRKINDNSEPSIWRDMTPQLTPAQKAAAVEAKKAESAKKAEAKKAESAKKAEAKKAESAKKAEAKKAESVKKAEAKKAESVKKAEAKKAESAKKAEAKNAESAKKAEAKNAESVKKAEANNAE